MFSSFITIKKIKNKAYFQKSVFLSHKLNIYYKSLTSDIKNERWKSKLVNPHIFDKDISILKTKHESMNSCSSMKSANQLCLNHPNMM